MEASEKDSGVIDKTENFLENFIKKRGSEKRLTIGYLDMSTDNVMRKGMHIAKQKESLLPRKKAIN